MSVTQMWAKRACSKRNTHCLQRGYDFFFSVTAFLLVVLDVGWGTPTSTHLAHQTSDHHLVRNKLPALMLRTWCPYLRASSFRASKRTWCCSLDSPNDLCARKRLDSAQGNKKQPRFCQDDKALRALSLAASSAGQGQGPGLFGNMTIESVTYRTWKF